MNVQYLALKLPGDGVIGTGVDPRFTDLGSLVSGLLSIFFYIAGFVLISWLSWGVFQYILAGGNKEALTKARARITYALVGFLILILSFAISEYTQGILKPNKNQGVQKLLEPPQDPNPDNETKQLP